tara:strand:- start:350 stop:571 length:222 start_codon:yes stop_codon:yes gene_type:complete
LALDNMTLRELQKESARVLATIDSTSVGLSKFNKLAHHNSLNWYKAVIQSYIDQYGDLPSKVGPGKDVKLINV